VRATPPKIDGGEGWPTLKKFKKFLDYSFFPDRVFVLAMKSAQSLVITFSERSSPFKGLLRRTRLGVPLEHCWPFRKAVATTRGNGKEMK